jgi:hypothetical protein
MHGDIVDGAYPAKAKGPSRGGTSVVLGYGLAWASVAVALGLAHTRIDAWVALILTSAHSEAT